MNKVVSIITESKLSVACADGEGEIEGLVDALDIPSLLELVIDSCIVTISEVPSDAVREILQAKVKVILNGRKELLDKQLLRGKWEVNKPLRRILLLPDGDLHEFIYKGQTNPCGCGANVYHKERDGEGVYGVCNVCGKDIYSYPSAAEIEWPHWRYKGTGER